MKYVYLSMLTFGSIFFGSSQEVLPLWPEGAIPFQLETETQEQKEIKDILLIRKVQEPTIEVFLPSKRNATGKGVLVFPGGGYRVLAYDWEGWDIAKFLNANGIAAFVVKYRLPEDADQSQKEWVPW